LEHDLARVWPRDDRDQLTRRKRIYAFATNNGWIATIQDPGIGSRSRKANPSKFELHLGHTIVWQKFLARARKAQEDGCMKTISKTRPGNVTPFVLEGRWALDRLDQQTMRSLSKEAKRKHVGVADVIYEAVKSFVAKCEAEADLERKIIKFGRR
jgi:hypothetical protein